MTEASTSICSLDEDDSSAFWLGLSCEGFDYFVVVRVTLGDLLTHIPLKDLCYGRGQRLGHPEKALFPRVLQSTDLSARPVFIVLKGFNCDLFPISVIAASRRLGRSRLSPCIVCISA